MTTSKFTFLILASLLVISLFEIADAAKKGKAKPKKQDKIAQAIAKETSHDVNKKAKAGIKIVMEMKMPTLAKDKKPKEGRIRDAVVDALKKHLPAFDVKDDAKLAKLLNEVASTDKALKHFKLHWEAKTKKGKIETELEKIVKKKGSVDEQTKAVIKITMEEKASQILKEKKKKNTEAGKRLADSVVDAVEKYLHDKKMEAKHLTQLMVTVGEHDEKLKKLKVDWKQMGKFVEAKMKANEKKKGKAAGHHEEKAKPKPEAAHAGKAAAPAAHAGKEKKAEGANKHADHPKGKGAPKKEAEKKKKSEENGHYAEEKHEMDNERGNGGVEGMEPIEGANEDEMPGAMDAVPDQNERIENEENVMGEDRLENVPELEGMGIDNEEAGEREDNPNVGGGDEMDGENVENKEGDEMGENGMGNENEGEIGGPRGDEEEDGENGKNEEENGMAA